MLMRVVLEEDRPLFSTYREALLRKAAVHGEQGVREFRAWVKEESKHHKYPLLVQTLCNQWYLGSADQVIDDWVWCNDERWKGGYQL